MIEDISFGKEISMGVLFGFIFIILNSVFGIAIGIPLLAFSSETEKYVIVSGIAPLVEEIVFRSVLPFILVIIGFPILVIAIGTVISFTFYHFSAYGASISAASSLFLGALIFGIVAFLMTYYDSDVSDFQVPVASIISHSIINTWLVVKQTGFVVVGI